MSHRIHHVNFVVRDLEAAVARWERMLGHPAAFRDRLPARGADIARFAVDGAWIVLVQPTQPGTPPWEHLERHGEGFFLLSLEVPSLAAEEARLGAPAFAGPARDGLDDWRVRDLDAAGTGNALVQLVETGRR